MPKIKFYFSLLGLFPALVFPALAEDPPSDHRPVISPDGETIVFMSTREGGDWELYRINRDGTGLKRLTHREGWDGYAAFSPDGEKFTFDREDGEPKPDGSSKKPFIYDLKTGKTEPFLEMEGVWATVNDWHPDGSKVVLFIERNKNRDLYFADAGGGNLVQVTNTPDQNEHDAHFSPDGKKLAFAFVTEGGSGFDVLDIETGEISRKATSTQYLYGLSWNPDGTKIVYTDTPNDNPEGNAELFVYDLETGQTKQVTHNDDYDHMPVWFNNREIMFTSYSSGREEVYILELETGEILGFDTGLE